MTAYGIAVGRKGRVGVALPFETIAKLTTFVVTLIYAAFCMLIWGIYAFWTPIAFAFTTFMFLRWCRKMVRAYREGKYGE